MRLCAVACAGLSLLAVVIGGVVAEQPRSRAPRYFPIDQTIPPGVASQWRRAALNEAPYFQPVRLEVPDGAGQVTAFGTSAGGDVVIEGNALLALEVGQVYRFRMSAMPEYAGVDLYPSVELIDRLHPPPGQAARFPVPVVFEPEEINAAISGRLVVKVIYVEQPDLVSGTDTGETLRTQFLDPRDNAGAQADLLGRPIALVRLGGRLPDPRTPDDPLFRSSASVQMVDPADAVPEVSKKGAPVETKITPIGHVIAGDCPVFCPPVERWCPPCEGVELGAAACAPCDMKTLNKHFPDEYLCDGGDRSHPVHFDQFNMLGLDTEDTIVQYADDTGKKHLKPTNRVCIYAPRLAAVTVINTVGEDTGFTRAGSSFVTHRGGDLRARQRSLDHQRNEATQRMVTRLRGSGLATQQQPLEVARDLAVATHVQALVAVGAHSFLRTGIFKQADEAVIAERVQAAAAWTKIQSVIIAGTVEGSGETVARKAPLDLTGVDIRRSIGKLRIVKMADKKQAERGDVVTFTIRYDNVGERSLTDVTITDNLTPRLEYVEDSGTSDRDGRLDTVDNGEGSKILKWTFDKPLEGRTGGVVTFQAKVK
jgi:uncharacterized repeat protein (TIGR01451 family)